MQKMEGPSRSGTASFQHLARLASRLLRTPMAVVTMRDGDRLRFEGSVGLPESRVREGEILLSETFCRWAVELGRPFAAEDVRLDPATRELRTVWEFGAASYLGIPLTATGGEVVGTISVMDTVPRRWSPEEIQDMQHLAETVLTGIRLVYETGERARVERTLRQKEELLGQMAESIGEAFWAVELEEEWEKSRVVYSNTAYERIFERSCESLYAAPWSSVTDVPEDDRQRIVASFRRAMRGEESWAEYRLVLPGGIKWVQTRYFPAHDPRGRVYRIVGLTRDITERRRAEEELQGARAHLEHVLVSSPGILYTSRAEGDYASTYVSPNVRDHFGYEPEEFTRDSAFWVNNLHPDDRDRILLDLTKLFERDRHVYEYRFRHRDGSWRWTRDEMRLLRDGTGGPREVVGYWIDITERRQAEEALLRAAHTQARFATALENLTTGVLITDPHQPDNPVIYTNPGVCAITGYSEDEILGRNCRFVQGPDTDPSTVREIHDAVAERKPFKGRILNYRKDGTSFWNELTISPVFDPEGRLINFVGLQSDVSQQVRAEEQIQVQLREKTVLLQEVHHRVKNNLQIISSLLNMQIRAIRDPQAIRVLQESRSRIHTIALAHETLYRSRSFARIDLADYLRSLVQQLQRSQIVGRPIELKLDLQSCWVPLTQAVPCGLLASELITNALKHGFQEHQRGEILVALRAEGNACTLVVSDNGAGLPGDIDLHHARTVGLQLVNDLTQQLEGTVDLRRSGGTEFRVTFSPESGAA